MNNHNLVTDQGLTFFDYEISIVALQAYRMNALKRWKRLDRLIADRAYLQTQIARTLHDEKKLSDEDLTSVWAEIDVQLYEYDEAPNVLYRRELLTAIVAAIMRLRKAARADREKREEGCNAA